MEDGKKFFIFAVLWTLIIATLNIFTGLGGDDCFDDDDDFL